MWQIKKSEEKNSHSKNKQNKQPDKTTYTPTVDTYRNNRTIENTAARNTDKDVRLVNTVLEGTLLLYGKSTTPESRQYLPNSIIFPTAPGSGLGAAATAHDHDRNNF